MFLHRISIGSSDDDSDVGGSSGSHCSTCAHCNSRTDGADSIHMGNNHCRIHTKDSSDTHSSGSRPQFPLTPARPNAAQV